MSGSDRDRPGIETPLLETRPGKRVASTALGVGYVVLSVGFFALDEPWYGIAHALLAVGWFAHAKRKNQD